MRHDAIKYPHSLLRHLTADQARREAHSEGSDPETLLQVSREALLQRISTLAIVGEPVVFGPRLEVAAVARAAGSRREELFTVAAPGIGEGSVARRFGFAEFGRVVEILDRPTASPDATGKVDLRLQEDHLEIVTEDGSRHTFGTVDPASVESALRPEVIYQRLLVGKGHKEVPMHFFPLILRTAMGEVPVEERSELTVVFDLGPDRGTAQLEVLGGRSISPIRIAMDLPECRVRIGPGLFRILPLLWLQASMTLTGSDSPMFVREKGFTFIVPAVEV